MERAIWIPKIFHHAKRPLSDRNWIIPLYHLLTERQKDRMLFQIIYDLKRSVDLRLLLITGALFILDDLVFNVIFIAKTFPKFTTSENYLSTNWIFKGNASSRLFSKQLVAEFAVTRRKCRFGNTRKPWWKKEIGVFLFLCYTSFWEAGAVRLRSNHHISEKVCNFVWGVHKDK